MSDIRFRIADDEDALRRAFAVRAMVFCDEQGIPYDLEHDENDRTALHVLGELDGEPAAAGRMRFIGDTAKLERLAVRKNFRGRGFGRMLTDYMIATAALRGCAKCKMHAQAYLKDFYAAHGFVVEGELFQEAGIDHYLMRRYP
jgi:predicted GNAT family N-acyltransferase